MNAVDIALYTKLTGDSGAGGFATLATGGIHKMMAPQGSGYPFSTFQDVSGVPIYSLTTERHRSLRYQFKMYDEGESWSVIGSMADRLEVLLNDTTLTITGWTLRYIRQIVRFDSVETDKSGIIHPLVVSEYAIDID